jgi:ABC-type multidrug transport system ATPase subunit
VSGLSTEARKRLTIAVELVTAPRVLFLDEPTSSLDSRGAELIALLMADVSHKQGVAVVSTIHQPSAAIMGLFDELLLLQRGRLVFSGPLGPGCSSLLHYLQAAVPNTPAFTPVCALHRCTASQQT